MHEVELVVSVFTHHTYPAGSLFSDLGFALPSDGTGYPLVLASGAPIAGQTRSFDLYNATPNAAAALIGGVSARSAVVATLALLTCCTGLPGGLPLPRRATN